MTGSDEPLREAIQGLLRKLLELKEFAGRDELLVQINGVEYSDGPVTMINLRVPRSYPPAKGVLSPVPSRPIVLDEAGAPIGNLLLWLDDEGYIDCLEYGWVADEMPTELPTPDRLAAS